MDLVLFRNLVMVGLIRIGKWDRFVRLEASRFNILNYFYHRDQVLRKMKVVEQVVISPSQAAELESPK